MTLSWRTAPRSIIKTLHWFNSVDVIENKDWNKTSEVKSVYGKSMHPTRRKFLYNISLNNDDDDYSTNKIRELGLDRWLSGQNDWTKEPESNARQRWTTFEQFGFSYLKNGIVKITPTGKMVIDGNFDGDQLIKQMLKMYTPLEKDKGVYIFQEFIRIIYKFKYLNRWELAFLFCISKYDDLKNIDDAIHVFRNFYLNLENKRKIKLINDKWMNIAKKYFEINWSKTQLKDKGKSYWNDYTDAFSRSLIYSGLFIDSGRGQATKIRIKDIELKKFLMLLNIHISVPNEEKSSINQMDWFGSSDNIKLPWDNYDNLSKIVLDKINVLKHENSDDVFDIYLDDIKNSRLSLSKLKSTEKNIDNKMSKYAIEKFVVKESESNEVRNEIIERYDMISSGASDMAALWLEANTWKFFASLADNPKSAIYNGTLNPDLTPRNYAKGVGNTPDMEIYSDDNILLPEVSLMTGVQQWEHEGSSVAEHVLRKKENNSNKNVMALFISKKTNFRSQWLFFILNKDSWTGHPVPIVPIEIDQFIRVVKFSYKYDLRIRDVLKLIQSMHEVVKDIDNFNEWQNKINSVENDWMQSIKNKELSI
ncbi:AlwI family type II restriction endonuclease [Apilactobacillus ozensis]|uniref:AlwI family type II restriction endonuclease n=1 Tax=Apilactobacillus ozensis TaxID=866801 RepID=UPI00200B7C92|nr:AlwI family type II restriction endonuclease [Apilactobacillus ozensis]MCK8606982.1 AlwI family type II restriction endonuclease [Apilactobacillus ozensis]